MKNANSIKNLWFRFLASGSSGIIITIFIMLITFAFLIPNFFRPNNFLNILIAGSLMGLVAIGESMLIIAGHFDLSPGAISAFSGVMVGILLRLGVNAFLAVVAVVTMGMLIGLINATLVNKLKFQPFIATLATSSAVRGLAYTVNKGNSEPIYNKSLLTLGVGRFLGIPIPVWFLIIVTLFFLIVLKYTRFGRNVYLVGDNPTAARLSGINIQGISTTLYIILSSLSALGGILLASRMNAGLPTASLGLEFDGITAAILGGIAFTGGVGTLTGTILGIFILQGFTNGLLIMNMPSYWQYVARGILMIVALSFDHLRNIFRR